MDYKREFIELKLGETVLSKNNVWLMLFLSLKIDKDRYCLVDYSLNNYWFDGKKMICWMGWWMNSPIILLMKVIAEYF